MAANEPTNPIPPARVLTSQERALLDHVLALDWTEQAQAPSDLKVAIVAPFSRVRLTSASGTVSLGIGDTAELATVDALKSWLVALGLQGDIERHVKNLQGKLGVEEGAS